MELLAGEAEDPADVAAAAGAHRDLPAPAGEPRERLARRADVHAARRRDEAADPERVPRGVDERVLVPAAALGAVGGLGDPVLAHRAAQRIVAGGGRVRPALGLLLGHAASLPRAWDGRAVGELGAGPAAR